MLVAFVVVVGGVVIVETGRVTAARFNDAATDAVECDVERGSIELGAPVTTP